MVCAAAIPGTLLGQQEEQLSVDEIVQLKSDIIKRSEEYAQDLINVNRV